MNPISGNLYENNGTYHFISDAPLDNDNLLVTGSLTLDGQLITVTAPISEIATELSAAVASAGFVTEAGLMTASGPLLTVTASTAILSMDSAPDTTLELDESEVCCFVAGTLIETDRGLVAVEDLGLGDMVVTRDNGLQPVRWIGNISLRAKTLRSKPKVVPIRIKVGALGKNIPATDLLVSPQHRILIRSQIAKAMFATTEILVAAKQLLLLDGVEVASDLTEVRYRDAFLVYPMPLDPQVPGRSPLPCGHRVQRHRMRRRVARVLIN